MTDNPEGHDPNNADYFDKDPPFWLTDTGTGHSKRISKHYKKTLLDEIFDQTIEPGEFHTPKIIVRGVNAISNALRHLHQPPHTGHKGA